MPVRLIRIQANVATPLLETNPDRLAFTIKNDDVEDCFIGHGPDVATSGHKQGIKVVAGGGWIEDEFHKGEVWGIATADMKVTVVEDVKLGGEEKKTKEE